MSGASHNRNADLQSRVDLVRDILLSELPAPQKLLSIGVVILSGEDGTVALGAEDLKRITSTNKRDTVFAAKKAIAEEGIKIVATISEAGKANRYRVMPTHVVTEIVAAYKRRAPVPQNGTPTNPPKRDVTRPPDRDVTRPEKVDVPVPQNGTGRVLVPARASKELPSEVLISKGYLTTHVEQDTAREGEESVGHGVFVNCETVRHREFTISIAGIAMQLATAPIDMTPEQRRDAARNSAIAHAMQWAAEIEGGKRPSDVVPSHVANFIRGAIVAQFNKSARSPARSGASGRPVGEGRSERAFRIAKMIERGEQP